MIFDMSGRHRIAWVQAVASYAVVTFALNTCTIILDISVRASNAPRARATAAYASFNLASSLAFGAWQSLGLMFHLRLLD